MKFSHSLQFNSVPDWADKYIAYSNLKKSIYTLEKDAVDSMANTSVYRDRPDDIENESAALLAGHSSETDPVFLPLIDKELRKVVKFYVSKQKELFAEVDRLEWDLTKVEEEGIPQESDRDESDDEYGLLDGDDEAESPGPTVRGTMTARGLRRSSLEAVFRNPAQYNEASRYMRNQTAEASSGNNRPNLTRARSDLSQSQPDASQQDNSLQVQAGSSGGNASGSQRKRSNSYNSQRNSQANPRWSFFRPRKARRESSGYYDTTMGSNNRSMAMGRADSEVGSSAWGDGKSIWTADHDYAIDMRITFKRRSTEIFVALSELQQFVALNATGIKKILKKYDKITGSSLKDRYLNDVVGQQAPFQEETKVRLEARIADVVALYAKVVTGGDVSSAASQLKTHLREEVVWQRNTVWREMIGIERRAQGATLERSVMGAAKTGSNGTPLRPFQSPFVDWDSNDSTVGRFCHPRLASQGSRAEVLWTHRRTKLSCYARLLHHSLGNRGEA